MLQPENTSASAFVLCVQGYVIIKGSLTLVWLRLNVFIFLVSGLFWFICLLGIFMDFSCASLYL